MLPNRLGVLGAEQAYVANARPLELVGRDFDTAYPGVREPPDEIVYGTPGGNVVIGNRIGEDGASEA